MLVSVTTTLVVVVCLLGGVCANATPGVTGKDSVGFSAKENTGITVKDDATVTVKDRPNHGPLSLIHRLHRSLKEHVTRKSRSLQDVPPVPCAPNDNWRVSEDYIVCGDGYCRCKNDIADCAGRGRDLTFIPALLDNISIVNFALNNLRTIQHDDFFHNVTDVVVLVLIGNNLTYISSGAFRSLRKLKELWLGFNNLTLTALAPALSVTTLTLLEVTINPLVALPDDLFHAFPLPHLETLCLGQVKMTHLNMKVFQPLKKLINLELAGNYLSHETLIPDVLPQLNALYLAGNPFHSFPKTCGNLGPFLPNLMWLDLSLCILETIPSSSICLPHLQTLTMLQSIITVISSNSFGQHLFPSLKTILISMGLKAQIYVEQYAFNNTMLEQVYLGNSSIDFADDKIHPDCFAGCPNLQELDLEGNDFSGVSNQKLQRLFNNNNVETLGLQSCSIGHISADMFSNLPNLACLLLYSNKLTDIPDGVFDKLEHLQLLDLSFNQISVVRETAFGYVTRQRLQAVSLSNNPFQCDCELRWFQHWLSNRPEIFSDCSQFYHLCNPLQCDNLPNTAVQSFHVVDQACLWSPAVSKFIIATLILLMLPLTAGAVLYRYRWHIRLVLYEAVRGRGDRWRRLREQDFRYDVFVSYDKGDLDWVLAHLMPELEGNLGLRLCLHQRDFTLGAPIVENIEESVKTSKKIMMLFSKNFARSHWCQFELQLCLNHVLQHGDALLVLILEDIPSRDLSPAMMAVMKTVTYIEWEDEPDARASFWDRISLALNEILV